MMFADDDDNQQARYENPVYGMRAGQRVFREALGTVQSTS